MKRTKRAGQAVVGLKARAPYRGIVEEEKNFPLLFLKDQINLFEPIREYVHIHPGGSIVTPGHRQL